jgi:DNA-binding MarR family transcriptional regulator
MSTLTDTQLVILSAAGQRDDGTALPLPKSLKLQGGAVSHVLKSLLKKRLLDEQPTRDNCTAWRESKDGQRLTLVITDAGRQAIGVAADERGETPQDHHAARNGPSGDAARQASRKGQPRRVRRRRRRHLPPRSARERSWLCCASSCSAREAPPLPR